MSDQKVNLSDLEYPLDFDAIDYPIDTNPEHIHPLAVSPVSLIVTARGGKVPDPLPRKDDDLEWLDETVELSFGAVYRSGATGEPWRLRSTFRDFISALIEHVETDAKGSRYVSPGQQPLQLQEQFRPTIDEEPQAPYPRKKNTGFKAQVTCFDTDGPPELGLDGKPLRDDRGKVIKKGVPQEQIDKWKRRLKQKGWAYAVSTSYNHVVKSLPGRKRLHWTLFPAAPLSADQYDDAHDAIDEEIFDGQSDSEVGHIAAVLYAAECPPGTYDQNERDFVPGRRFELGELKPVAKPSAPVVVDSEAIAAIPADEREAKYVAALNACQKKAIEGDNGRKGTRMQMRRGWDFGITSIERRADLLLASKWHTDGHENGDKEAEKRCDPQWTRDELLATFKNLDDTAKKSPGWLLLAQQDLSKKIRKAGRKKRKPLHIVTDRKADYAQKIEAAKQRSKVFQQQQCEALRAKHTDAGELPDGVTCIEVDTIDDLDDATISEWKNVTIFLDGGTGARKNVLCERVKRILETVSLHDNKKAPPEITPLRDAIAEQMPSKADLRSMWVRRAVEVICTPTTNFDTLLEQLAEISAPDNLSLKSARKSWIKPFARAAFDERQKYFARFETEEEKQGRRVKQAAWEEQAAQFKKYLEPTQTLLVPVEATQAEDALSEDNSFAAAMRGIEALQFAPKKPRHDIQTIDGPKVHQVESFSAFRTSVQKTREQLHTDFWISNVCKQSAARCESVDEMLARALPLAEGYNVTNRLRDRYETTVAAVKQAPTITISMKCTSPTRALALANSERFDIDFYSDRPEGKNREERDEKARKRNVSDTFASAHKRAPALHLGVEDELPPAQRQLRSPIIKSHHTTLKALRDRLIKPRITILPYAHWGSTQMRQVVNLMRTDKKVDRQILYIRLKQQALHRNVLLCDLDQWLDKLFKPLRRLKERGPFPIPKTAITFDARRDVEDFAAALQRLNPKLRILKLHGRSAARQALKKPNELLETHDVVLINAAVGHGVSFTAKVDRVFCCHTMRVRTGDDITQILARFRVVGEDENIFLYMPKFQDDGTRPEDPEEVRASIRRRAEHMLGKKIGRYDELDQWLTDYVVADVVRSNLAWNKPLQSLKFAIDQAKWDFGDVRNEVPVLSRFRKVLKAARDDVKAARCSAIMSALDRTVDDESAASSQYERDDSCYAASERHAILHFFGEVTERLAKLDHNGDYRKKIARLVHCEKVASGDGYLIRALDVGEYVSSGNKHAVQEQENKLWLAKARKKGNHDEAAAAKKALQELRWKALTLDSSPKAQPHESAVRQEYLQSEFANVAAAAVGITIGQREPVTLTHTKIWKAATLLLEGVSDDVLDMIGLNRPTTVGQVRWWKNIMERAGATMSVHKLGPKGAEYRETTIVWTDETHADADFYRLKIYADHEQADIEIVTTDAQVNYNGALVPLHEVPDGEHFTGILGAHRDGELGESTVCDREGDRITVSRIQTEAEELRHEDHVFLTLQTREARDSDLKKIAVRAVRRQSVVTDLATTLDLVVGRHEKSREELEELAAVKVADLAASFGGKTAFASLVAALRYAGAVVVLGTDDVQIRWPTVDRYWVPPPVPIGRQAAAAA